MAKAALRELGAMSLDRATGLAAGRFC